MNYNSAKHRLESDDGRMVAVLSRGIDSGTAFAMADRLSHSQQEVEEAMEFHREQAANLEELVLGLTIENEELKAKLADFERRMKLINTRARGLLAKLPPRSENLN